MKQEIESAFQDIRYACRSLRRSPGFTAVVVTTLALGIGAILTMFSLMRAVLWRPLPYPEPDRIVTIQVDARNVPNTGATLGEVLDLKELSRSFDQLSMIGSDDADLEYLGETEHVSAARVSDNFLPLLGARPALGRTLDSHLDESPQQVHSVLISDELWRRRFSADNSVIGKAVRINDLEVHIAGVMPPGLHLFLPPSVGASEQIDVWLPYSMSATRQFRGVPIAARLRPGVTLAQANAELETLAAQFERQYPDFYAGDKGWQASPFDRASGSKLRFTARLLRDDMTRGIRPALFLLSGAVGFVLLIACVNVANLMLARGSARQRELEIRRALGAGRNRIIRQLLTEGLVLALASAAIGLFCAHLGVKAIARLSGSYLPLSSGIGMDSTVVICAFVLAVLTNIVFGLLPAWRLSCDTDPLRAGRTETAGSGARGLQRTLVVAEVALSIMPLACGGLMLRSFLNLLHSPLGFNPANVVTATVPVNLNRFPQTAERWAWLRDVLDHVRAIPGVQSASAATPLPLAGQQTRRVGRADQSDALPILATQQIAIPGYLNAIGTPLLAGRDFTDDDIVPGRSVTIIDEQLAKRLWPDGAIGKRLSVYRTGWRNDLEVVGVTASVRVTRIRDEGIPHFVMPYSQYPDEMSLVIKTREPALRMTSQIERAVDAAHGGRAARDVMTMSDYVSASIGDTRFVLCLLATFAAMSVLLAAVGLYGTLAYLTTQRTREFGIRLALGATGRAIMGIVMREGVSLAVAGVVLGLFGTAASTRVIGQLLYGVRPLDSLNLASVVLIVGVIALGAAGVPAWRATRIDPQASLRND